jgi:hypothetical protein
MTITRRPRTANKGKLQQKLDEVVKRVVGSSSSPSSSTRDDDDDDVCSEYGGECKNENNEDALETTMPDEALLGTISSPSSYIDLALLNPYGGIDTENLTRSLSLLPKERTGKEDGQQDLRTRLASQLDRAHATILAEESAALQALRQQIQLTLL